MAEFKLTRKWQLNKRCKDNRSRNFVIYFLNNIQIFKQKIPFDAEWERGFDRRTSITKDYLLNGRIHQIRVTGWFCGAKNDNLKTRAVSFPVSKTKLKEIGVPNDLKIQCTEYR